MNEQIPPIDAVIRAQLQRRSGGRLPDGLLTEVSGALDGVGEPRAPLPRSGFAGTGLRLGAGIGVALVAVLAVAIALPWFRAGPASSLSSYPADRALTTAELAVLMAGPALPTNTAIVASVTIDARNDVCPMNHYPTVGIVEAMPSQVCVMGEDLSAQLPEPATAGTFAFRYLAPGYLGLLGEVTPASSSTVAFRAADDWPVGGKTFIVDGWLGAVDLTESCATTPSAGDVLDPNGEDCPYDDWLADDPTAPSIVADHDYAAPSFDMLSLRGNARHVGAGGARVIDSIDPAAPVHGIYVVRSVTGPCPGASPVDNRGCVTWRVLADVAAVSLTRPSTTSAGATPTPATAPPASPVSPPTDPPSPTTAGLLGTGNRPLIAAELPALWAADPAHLSGRIAIVKGPVPTGFECRDAGAAGPSASAPPCLVTVLDPAIALDGYWAVRVGADGRLGIVGEVAVPNNGFVFTLGAVPAASGKPAASHLVMVDAWLDWANDCDTLPTESPGTQCGYSILTAEKLSWMHMRTLFPPEAVGQWVQPNDAYALFGSQDAIDGAIHGLYLVDGSTMTIVARLEPVAP